MSNLDLTKEGLANITNINRWMGPIPICYDCGWCRYERICSRPRIDLVSGRIYYHDLEITCERERAGAPTYSTLFGKTCGHDGIYWEPKAERKHAEPE